MFFETHFFSFRTSFWCLRAPIWVTLGCLFVAFCCLGIFLKIVFLHGRGVKNQSPRVIKITKESGKTCLWLCGCFEGPLFIQKINILSKKGPERILNLCLNPIFGSLDLIIFALGAPDAPKTLQIWKKTSPRRQNRWKLKPQGLINRCELTEKSLKSGLDHRCTTYEKYKRMPWDFPNGGPSSKVYIYIYKKIMIYNKYDMSLNWNTI